MDVLFVMGSVVAIRPGVPQGTNWGARFVVAVNAALESLVSTTGTACLIKLSTDPRLGYLSCISRRPYPVFIFC